MADAQSRKRFIIRTAVLFVLLPFIHAPGSADAPITVRVLTYNIHHGEGRDGQFDLPRYRANLGGVKSFRLAPPAFPMESMCCANRNPVGSWSYTRV